MGVYVSMASAMGMGSMMGMGWLTTGMGSIMVRS